MKTIQKILSILTVSLAGLLIIPLISFGAYVISQGGTATSSFDGAGLVGTPGGLNYLRTFKGSNGCVVQSSSTASVGFACVATSTLGITTTQLWTDLGGGAIYNTGLGDVSIGTNGDTGNKLFVQGTGGGEFYVDQGGDTFAGWNGGGSISALSGNGNFGCGYVQIGATLGTNQGSITCGYDLGTMFALNQGEQVFGYAQAGGTIEAIGNGGYVGGYADNTETTASEGLAGFTFGENIDCSGARETCFGKNYTDNNDDEFNIAYHSIPTFKANAAGIQTTFGVSGGLAIDGINGILNDNTLFVRPSIDWVNRLIKNSVGSIVEDYSGSTISVPGIQITTSPTSGYVLTSDSSGNGTWQVLPPSTNYWTNAGASTTLTTGSTAIANIFYATSTIATSTFPNASINNLVIPSLGVITNCLQTDTNGVVGGIGKACGLIQTINTDSRPNQNLNVGTIGTDFHIVDDTVGDHTFDLPSASSTARGALTSADWIRFNNAVASSSALNGVSPINYNDSTGAISITLPITQVQGGTGTTTNMTAGSVIFATSSNQYAQDNSKFYWNDNNFRLGIGTTTSASTLGVVGAGISTGITLQTSGSTGTSTFIVLDNGNVGIGKTSPAPTSGTNLVLEIGSSTSANTNAIYSVDGVCLTRSSDGSCNAGISRNIVSGTSVGLNFNAGSSASNYQWFENGATPIMDLVGSVLTVEPAGGSVGASQFDYVTNSPVTIYSDDAATHANGIILDRSNRTARGNNAVTVFQYNGLEQARITTQGMFGLGTTTPSAILAVVGQTGSSTMNIASSSGLTDLGVDSSDRVIVGASGITTLSGGASGTITPTALINSKTRIMLTIQSCSTCGTPYVSATTTGTFTIGSTNILDASQVAWELIQSN